jgi:serine/threonine protein kinase/tetratricopeptide (TPR) repeat protein
MICHACGAESGASNSHCPACGAVLGQGRGAPTRLDGAVTRLPAHKPESHPGAPGGTAPETRPPFRPREDPRAAVTFGSRPTGGVADADLPPPSPDSTIFKPGHAFGSRYRIEQLLGVGGMGAVYRARDAELAVDVALKVVRPEIAADPAAAKDLQQRFKRELLLARQVTHKNVVRIHDIGEVDGVKYITMPFIEGEDLIATLKREGRLPVERAIRILRGALAGLVAAHQAGVVHRDLKPANVMVAADDEALIMDFGIARLSDPAEGSAAPGAKPGGGPSAGSTAFLRESLAADGRTQLGTVIGTIEYMAPEQAAGILVDQRADVYALGMIVHEMLSGLRTFQTTGDALVDLTSRRKTPPPLLRSLNDAVPETVERMVAKCLRPSADERYQTSAELAAELDQLDDRGVPLPRPQKLLRSPKFWVAASLVVGTLLGATWWAAVKLGTPPVEVQRAPVSILVADFVNETGEKVFDGVLETSVGVGLEAAKFVSAYQRSSALRIAHQISAGDRLDESASRLVAMREGIKYIVSGKIAKNGTRYTVSARGLDPTSGKQEFVAEVKASNRDRVLAATGDLAADLRSALGETRSVEARENFSSASLDAVAAYIKGQQAVQLGRNAEAIEGFREATERDPGFARAYGGWAIAATRLGRREEADRLWKIALGRLDQISDRERYRLLGAYYTEVTRNYDTAIDTYETLVREYPADGAGHNNLAVGYFRKLDFARALQEGERSLEIYPNSPLYRTNYALYAMYAGDFDNAAKQAQRLVDEKLATFEAFVPIAVAALAKNDKPAAVRAYEAMAASGPPGRSLARVGLADLALADGRPAEAIAQLRQGIADDQKSENEAGVASKRIVLAEALALQGAMPAALVEVRNALKIDRGPAIAVPAARLLIAGKREQEASAIGADFDNRLDRQNRAYGRMIAGLIAMSKGRHVEAIEAYNEALKLVDVWLVRFNLGVAFIEAGYFAEALKDFEACQKRRGEASAVFLNDEPTARYQVPVGYWIGRSKEGLGLLPQAQENYRAFVALRAADSPDPLLGDARRRLGGR